MSHQVWLKVSYLLSYWTREAKTPSPNPNAQNAIELGQRSLPCPRKSAGIALCGDAATLGDQRLYEPAKPHRPDDCRGSGARPVDGSDLEAATNHLPTEKGDVLELILYTTDFECTIRDNSDWTISIDLNHSTIHLPR